MDLGQPNNPDQFEFVWYAAKDKKRPIYRWVERHLEWFENPRHLVLAMRKDAELRPFKPLQDDEERGLFLTFGATEPTEEGLLDFANRHGRLGARAEVRIIVEDDNEVLPGLVLPGGNRDREEHFPTMELSTLWIEEAIWMRHLTEIWTLVNDPPEGKNAYDELSHYFIWKKGSVVVKFPPVEALGTINRQFDWRRHGKVTWPREYLSTPTGEPMFKDGDVEGPALKFLQGALNAALWQAATPAMIWSHRKQMPVFALVPIDLLGAMYIQFALVVDKKTKFGRCPICLKSFLLAPGVNRTNRVTCSLTCRTYLYRQRIELARQLHAKGKSVRDIVKELGVKDKGKGKSKRTGIEIVKSWIAKEH